jgi:hypothetical protein
MFAYMDFTVDFIWTYLKESSYLVRRKVKLSENNEQPFSPNWITGVLNGCVGSILSYYTSILSPVSDEFRNSESIAGAIERPILLVPSKVSVSNARARTTLISPAVAIIPIVFQAKTWLGRRIRAPSHIFCRRRFPKSP